jgi:hypothetical protein
MFKPGLVIVLLVSYTSICIAQSKSYCLSDQQLVTLQRSSIEEQRSFLAKEGWRKDITADNQTKYYLDFMLDYEVEKWQQKTSAYFEGNIYIYHKGDIPNLIIYQTSNSCFTNLLDQLHGNLKLAGLNSYKNFFSYMQNGTVIEFRNYSNENSDKRFSVLIFNNSSLTKLVQIERAKKEAEEARIRAEIEARRLAEAERISKYKTAYESGNKLYNEKRYEEALVQFEIVKENIQKKDKNPYPKLESLIAELKRVVNQQTFEKYINNGDSLLAQKKFDEALLNYYNAFKVDNENEELIAKIKEVKDILNILDIQRTEQSYSQIKPLEYNNFLKINYDAMNSLLNHSRKEGSLDYSILIKFDINGQNQSSLKINSLSYKKLKSFFNSINVNEIPPSVLYNFNIASKEILDFNLSWEIQKQKAIVRSQSIRIDNNGITNSVQDNNIRAFINRQSNKNGIYKFELNHKTLNSKTYDDLKLTSLRTTDGPMNVLYSMVLPGLGTKKVTDGSKGKGKMTFFLISTAVSIGSKVYSNNQFAKYKGMTDADKKQEFYDKANIGNKIFLISGGISATIYIHDFFYVISRGAKNAKKNKLLRNDLKNGPIFLQESLFKN